MRPSCLFYVLLNISLQAILQSNICYGQCKHHGTILECHGLMPKVISQSTTVFVNELKVSDKLDFSDHSWKNVTELSIKTESLSTGFRTLSNDEFVELTNLETLRIGNNIIQIRNHAFRGLNKLEILDLSYNAHLSFKVFVSALCGSNCMYLPNLTELYLANVSLDHLKPDDCIIGTDFYLAIQNKTLKVLDLSGIKDAWFDDSKDSEKAFIHLEKLNLSGADLAVVSFAKLILRKGNASLTSFQNLQVLDISYPYISPEMTTLFFGSMSKSVIQIHYPHNLREVYAKGLFKTPVSIYGISSTNQFCLSYKRLDQQRCAVGNFSGLKKLDMSENFIKYLDPKLAYVIKDLEVLDVSQNKLGHQIAETGDGGIILEALNRLTVLKASYNKITSILLETFKHSRFLKVLDLSQNDLPSITFRTQYLFSLQMLDISFNKISFLDSVSISRLNSLLYIGLTNMTNETYHSKKPTVAVTLYGNPFVCRCESVAFLKWLLALNETYFCTLNTKSVPVDFLAIQNAEYMCKENIVIAVYLTFAVTLVFVSAAASYTIFKQHRKEKGKQQKRIAIEMFQVKAKEPVKCPPPVFLSFCSHDDDVIAEHVLPKLNTGLQTVLGTNMRTVATGVTDIRLGLPLGNEIIRCIEASSVVVFFLTKAFCKSSWCRYEAQEAHLEKKLIVLMFWEEVDSKCLPVEFRKFLSQMTCVYWNYRNGRSVMKPGWVELCEIIVGLLGEAETTL